MSYCLGVVRDIVGLYIIVMLGVIRLKNCCIRKGFSIVSYTCSYYNLYPIISPGGMTIDGKGVSSCSK